MIQEPVRRYIDRLHVLIDARQNRFSQDELMDIAWEIGMSQEEFIQLKEQTLLYIDRAYVYMEVEQWKNALEEIEAACELDPLNPYTLFHKAKIYAARWKEEKNWKWKLAAEQVIYDCLQLSPEHTSSLALLEEMKRWRKKEQRFNITKALVALAILAVIAGGITFFQYYYTHNNIPTDVSIIEQERYNATALCLVPSHLIGVEMTVGNVQISHPVGENSRNRIQYSYSGNIICDSLELAKVFCQVTFKDSNQTVLAVESFQLLDAVREDGSYDHRRSMHPADMLSFSRENSWGLPAKPSKANKIASVVFELKEAQAQLVINEFEKYSELRLPWQTRRPYYLRLKAYNRLDSLLRNPFDSLVTHQSQIAIEHYGKKDCRSLKLLLSWKDATGNLLKEQKIAVLDTTMLPLKPQHHILISHREFFKSPEYAYDQPFDRFSIRVLEAY